MHGLLPAVLRDDGQLAFRQQSEVDHRMVVTFQALAGGKFKLHGHQLGASLQIIGELHAIPALAGAKEFGALHLGGTLFFACFHGNQSLIRHLPVISTGGSSPMMWRMEGATSDRAPSSTFAFLFFVT